MNTQSPIEIRLACSYHNLDFLIGQIYFPETDTWGDVVYVDSFGFSPGNTGFLPKKFGNIHVLGRWLGYNVTRNSISRPAVAVYSYLHGGESPSHFEIISKLSHPAPTYSNVKLLKSDGSYLQTDLPGLGLIDNSVRINENWRPIGWIGMFGNSLSWEMSPVTENGCVIRKCETTNTYPMISNSGFFGSLTEFNTWANSNKLEYGCSLTIGTEHLRENTVQNIKNSYLCLTSLFFEASAWKATTRTNSVRLDHSVPGLITGFCGGNTLTNGIILRTSDPTAINQSGQASFRKFNDKLQQFIFPSSSGGTITIVVNPVAHIGAIVTPIVNKILTYSNQGIITNLTVTPTLGTNEATVDTRTWVLVKQQGTNQA